ncbi:hypothetical protein DACRYDRAFT_17971 [Dacryopinax primogenitus]|uniref:Uncharacterized protein n=1 Tax=Dacryopinax primogenitus (strain DJM 731) TaxID=1858805 RepID=M5FPW8_DACPD|nr:uncharacterized protein DACRYDRAFT_17971 [Dacryopinax primogenitus]EJT98830.1 hypothetical protein DACRYDRAFT_17971 [Dacryopinax primogenitus]
MYSPIALEHPVPTLSPPGPVDGMGVVTKADVDKAYNYLDLVKSHKGAGAVDQQTGHLVMVSALHCQSAQEYYDRISHIYMHQLDHQLSGEGLMDVARFVSRMNEMEARFNKRFNQIEGRVDSVDIRLDNAEQRCDNLEEYFSRINNQIEKRFESIDTYLTGFESRFETFDMRFNKMDKRLSQLQETNPKDQPIDKNAKWNEEFNQAVAWPKPSKKKGSKKSAVDPVPAPGWSDWYNTLPGVVVPHMHGPWPAMIPLYNRRRMHPTMPGYPYIRSFDDIDKADSATIMMWENHYFDTTYDFDTLAMRRKRISDELHCIMKEM